MYFLTFGCLLLSFTTAHAHVAVRRDEADEPTMAPAPGPPEPVPTSEASEHERRDEAGQPTMAPGKGPGGNVPSSGNVTTDGVQLIRYDGCTSEQENAIYDGWTQARRLMNVKAVKEGKIDFNSAAALEYLGPSSRNKDQQKNLNDLFKQFATIQPSLLPFQWRLHVRCDDPVKQCKKTSYAYTDGRDAESKQARINFCRGYFEASTIDQVIDRVKNLPKDKKLDMTEYQDTQGFLFAHELMHVTWATKSKGKYGNWGPNEPVVDLTIKYTSRTGQTIVVPAYGAYHCKLIARYNEGDTGKNVIRNADSLVLFMGALYIQSVNDNTYPYLPIFDGDSSHLDEPPYAQSLNDKLVLSQDGEKMSPINLNSFAPDSEYPKEYIASHKAWLASAKPKPKPTSTKLGSPCKPTKVDNTAKTVCPAGGVATVCAKGKWATSKCNNLTPAPTQKPKPQH